MDNNALLKPSEGVSATEVMPVTENMELKPIGYYAQAIRGKLPEDIFRAHPARLSWYGFYFGVMVLGWWLIVVYQLPWWLKTVISLGIGTSYGAMGFLTHEIFHGSVIKNQKVQQGLGFIGLTPFFISPTFWKYWHNRLHHSRTQEIIHDPDAYPTLKIFNHSKFMRFMFPFTPGSGHKRSALYLFMWFSVHTFVAQIYLRFRNSIYKEMNHRRVSLEMAGQGLIWIAMLSLVGWDKVLWLWFIPLFAQNYFVMSYIATNHNLSPLTKVNDPLANSLTVTNNSILESFHLNFGYHVEHHIFPTINGSKIKAVHEILKRDFASRYKHMAKSSAIKTLYSTPRIYKDRNTLIHPETRVMFTASPYPRKIESPSI